MIRTRAAKRIQPHSMVGGRDWILEGPLFSLLLSLQSEGEDDVFRKCGHLVSVNPQSTPPPLIPHPHPLWPTVGKPRANMFSTSAGEIKDGWGVESVFGRINGELACE